MRFLDVAIVGCGTAGPATALFLARDGHRVTLFERFRAPKAVGAGIMLQPTGQAVLAELGLRDEVVARGARVDALHIETRGRKRIARLEYATVGDEVVGYGMHRGALFASLFRAVQASPVTLRLGVEAVDLARGGGDRHFLVDREGRRHGPFDLVVVADGARSQLRDDTDWLLRKSVKPYPWGALWFIGEDPEGHFAGELRQVVHGTGTLAGMLPSGLGPDPANRTPLVSLFWSVRCDRVEAFRAAPLDAWKETFLSCFPAAGPFLAQIRTHDDLLFASYHDVVMPRWHTPSVVYLGDAAHATSPQLGQGCNLALYDALVLARCLEAADSVPSALAAYSSARHEHLGFYQVATRWLTPFFQSDHEPLGPLRDTFMTLAARIPFFHREMVLAMCGGKQGFVWPRRGVTDGGR
jgi:2-polyprenyl-6-methoxyphenol hydroxylase-like FAD-dependent oxidoreductase